MLPFDKGGWHSCASMLGSLQESRRGSWPMPPPFGRATILYRRARPFSLHSKQSSWCHCCGYCSKCLSSVPQTAHVVMDILPEVVKVAAHDHIAQSSSCSHFWWSHCRSALAEPAGLAAHLVGLDAHPAALAACSAAFAAYPATPAAYSAAVDAHCLHELQSAVGVGHD